MSLKLTMTSIFIMSDRAASRGTFRIEANQTSKVEQDSQLIFMCKRQLVSSRRLQAVEHFLTKFHLQCLTAFPLGENNTNWIQHDLFVKSCHGQQYLYSRTYNKIGMLNIETALEPLGNGKIVLIVWKIVWIEYYLRLKLSSQRYQLVPRLPEHTSNVNTECAQKVRMVKTAVYSLCDQLFGELIYPNFIIYSDINLFLIYDH